MNMVTVPMDALSVPKHVHLIFHTDVTCERTFPMQGCMASKKTRFFTFLSTTVTRVKGFHSKFYRMLLQALGSCHVKMTLMQEKASILFKISWINFFPDNRCIYRVSQKNVSTCKYSNNSVNFGRRLLDSPSLKSQ